MSVTSYWKARASIARDAWMEWTDEETVIDVTIHDAHGVWFIVHTPQDTPIKSDVKLTWRADFAQQRDRSFSPNHIVVTMLSGDVYTLPIRPPLTMMHGDTVSFQIKPRVIRKTKPK